MAQIILNDEQAKAVQAANGALELRDSRGNLLGYVSPPISSAEIGEALRRLHSDGPWYTTQQVLDRLKSVERE
jgi:hypothetical protein